jgi:hypothetical protein
MDRGLQTRLFLNFLDNLVHTYFDFAQILEQNRYCSMAKGDLPEIKILNILCVQIIKLCICLSVYIVYPKYFVTLKLPFHIKFNDH